MTNWEHATRIPLLIGCAGGGCIPLEYVSHLLEEAVFESPAFELGFKLSDALRGVRTEGRRWSVWPGLPRRGADLRTRKR